MYTTLTAKQQYVSTFTAYHWRRAILYPFLVTRLLLLIVGYLTWMFVAPHFEGASFLPSHQSLLTVSWQMWRWFDSFWYLGITEHGYAPASALHHASNWVFYPLYPFSVYIVGRLFGDTDAGFTLAGILVSNGAALIALTYLYLLVERDLGERVALRTVLYLVAFPLSFYLSAVYTESLWLAFAIASLYYTRRHAWGMAGLLGALAALTHPQGVALLIPILWEYWQVMSESVKPVLFECGWRRVKAWSYSRTFGLVKAAKYWYAWRGLLYVCCVPLGLLVFFGYAWLKTGDFFAEFDTEKWGWGRQTMPPWMTIYHALQHPLPFSVTDYSAWPVSMAFIAVFVMLLLFMGNNLPAIYTIYAALMIFFPLSTGNINSTARFYLIVFPAQILIARWSIKEKRGILHWSIFSLCLIGECVGMACFVLGFPFIA